MIDGGVLGRQRGRGEGMYRVYVCVCGQEGECWGVGGQLFHQFTISVAFIKTVF